MTVTEKHSDIAAIQTYLFFPTLLQKLCHTVQKFYLIKSFCVCVKYQASSTLQVRSRLAQGKLTAKELFIILIFVFFFAQVQFILR